MGGMLGNFIAGAAGQAADYTQKSGLQQQLQEAELLKAQRISDINAASKENERSAAQDRGAEYYSAVSEPVAGAATPMDDDGNPTDVNASTKMRPATNREALQAATTAGDLPAAGFIESMQHKDDQIASMQERERTRILTNTNTVEGRVTASENAANARVEASENYSDARKYAADNSLKGLREKLFNPDGTRAATAGQYVADSAMFRTQVQSVNRAIEIDTKEINKIKSGDLNVNIPGVDTDGKPSNKPEDKVRSKQLRIDELAKNIKDNEGKVDMLTQARAAWQKQTKTTPQITPGYKPTDSRPDEEEDTPTRPPLSSFMGK